MTGVQTCALPIWYSDYATPGLYRDPEEFFAELGRIYQREIADLATAGAQYVQLDEVALAMLCDPVARDKVKAGGYDPEHLVDLYVEAINEAVKNRPANMVVGVHMCRGNYKGKSCPRAATTRSRRSCSSARR